MAQEKQPSSFWSFGHVPHVTHSRLIAAHQAEEQFTEEWETVEEKRKKKRERTVSWKGECKVDEEGGQQEESKVVENVMGWTEKEEKG